MCLIGDVMDFDLHQLTTSRTCQSQSCANCASPPPHISPYLAVKRDIQHSNFCLCTMFSNIRDLADPFSLFWESESRPHHLPSWAREWIVYPTITSLRGSQLATCYNRMQGALQFSFQFQFLTSIHGTWKGSSIKCPELSLDWNFTIKYDENEHRCCKTNLHKSHQSEVAQCFSRRQINSNALFS